jgi:hypothetical protein
MRSLREQCVLTCKEGQLGFNAIAVDKYININILGEVYLLAL